MDTYEKCKSCKYYIEHYILLGTIFRPIGGHCINRELNRPRKRNKYELIENCEHWEINTDVKEKQKKKIKDALFFIEEHLFYIEQMLFLNEDENASQ